MMACPSSYTLLLIVATVLWTGAEGLCVEGERFDSVTKTCITCECGAGEEMDSNTVIPMDKDNGAMACPACKACLHGYYSNQETQFTCVICSTDCQREGRTTEFPCYRTQNRRCGGCLNGYYEMFPSSPCLLCTTDTSQIPECQAYTTQSTKSVLFQQRTTKDGTFTSTSVNEERWNSGRNYGSGLIMTILIFVLILVICGATYCIVKVVKLCHTSNSSGNYNSVSTFSSGASTFTKIHGGTYDVEEYVANDTEENETKVDEVNIQLDETFETNNVEIDGTKYVEKSDMEKIQNNYVQEMKIVKLERSDTYLRIVSTKIDDNPKPLFQELKIEKSVIYQETQRNKDDVCEQHLQILNRWVSKMGQDANLVVLYEALQKHGFSLACSYIIQLVQKKCEMV